MKHTRLNKSPSPWKQSRHAPRLSDAIGRGSMEGKAIFSPYYASKKELNDHRSFKKITLSSFNSFIM